MECLGCISPTGHIRSAAVLTFDFSEMLFLSICQDVKTVRVGRPEKIRPELEKITLDNQCKLYKQLAQASMMRVWRSTGIVCWDSVVAVPEISPYHP